MGRLSTSVAAAGVDAGNLPEKLPNISLFDALLPRSWSRSKSDKSQVGKKITYQHHMHTISSCPPPAHGKPSTACKFIRTPTL